MLAVLGSRKAELLVHQADGKTDNFSLSPEEEDKVNNTFDTLYQSLPKRQRGFVEEQMSVGPSGYLGVSWAASETACLAEEGHVMVLLMGNVNTNYSGMEDAEFVINEYHDACNGGRSTSADGETLEWTLDIDGLVCAVKGHFCLLLYDRKHDKLVVMRDDKTNTRPLYCGRHVESGDVIFADSMTLLDMCHKDLSTFPNRCLYIYSSGNLLQERCPADDDKKKKRRLRKVESSSHVHQMHDTVKNNSVGQVAAA